MENPLEGVSWTLSCFIYSNQEVIEQIKINITAKELDRKKDTEAADKSMGILKYIKERICEMIFKVQEVDETNIDIRERKLHVTVSELPNYLTHIAQDEDLIEVTASIHVER